MEKWDEDLIKKIEEINKSEETPYAYFSTTAERDEALHEDMKRVINVVKENSNPIDQFEKDMESMDKRIKICKEQAQSIRHDISEHDKGVEEMRQISAKIEEINQPTKRWWHIFKKPSPMSFDIPGRPVFTKEELAERRAFLDGYGEGRKDGDSHEAYKLWKKMRDFE